MRSKLLFEASEQPTDLLDVRSMDKKMPCAEMADGATVTDRTPEENGAWVRLSVRVVGAFAPFDQEDARSKKSHTVRVLTALYAELGIRVGESLSVERAEALLEAEQVSRAIVWSESSLAYGDRSARKMTQKLLAKGFSPRVAARTVGYLKAKGWLRENEAALRRAEQDVKKRWGVSRIRNDLYAQGYDREAIDEAIEALLDSDVDFVENCVSVIQKKYGGVPTDTKARQSMKAALLRLGYTPSEIREAMEQCSHDSLN